MHLLFIFITMDSCIFIILWVKMKCSVLFLHSSLFFGHLEGIQLYYLSFKHRSISAGYIILNVTLEDASGSSCKFSYTVLRSAFSPKCFALYIGKLHQKLRYRCQEFCTKPFNFYTKYDLFVVCNSVLHITYTIRLYNICFRQLSFILRVIYTLFHTQPNHTYF